VEKFTLPESLAALSTADLAGLEAQAMKAFGALQKIGPDDITDANVAEMERLAGDIQTLRTESAGRVTAATARKDRAAAAAALVTAATKTKDADEDDEDDDDLQSEDEKAVERAEEEDEETPDVAKPIPPAETATSGVTVTASGKRRTPSVREAAKPPVRRPSSDIVLTAAADVPGFANGQNLDDMKAVAKAFAARAGGFPRGRVPDTYIRSGVASMQRDFSDGLVDTNRDLDGPLALFDEAGKESRLPGGSLVASGGWCAPSETFYDLCVTEELDGIIDIPEVGITRGGIRFTKGPAFEDIYADAGFMLTEAQVIAGTQKPCVEIDCPPFEEVRLDVSGICVKAPILTNVGYPELVQRWIEGTLVAQAHKEAAEVIRRMVAIADAPVTLTGGAGTGFDLLTGIEWVVTTQKYRWRLSRNATLEVVAPYWALGIIRADLQLRQGRETMVTDAEINAHFAARGARVQWVYNYQDLAASGAGACVAAGPDKIQILAYPAGTFVKGVADVISLDAIYDSTNIVQNMYTAVFAESGFLVANRCWDACVVEVPVCLLGASGGAIDACLPVGKDPVAP
jgi:hypothetical protein